MHAPEPEQYHQTHPVEELIRELEAVRTDLATEAAFTIRRLLRDVKRLEARLFMSEPRKMAVTTFHPQPKEPNHE